MARAVRPPNSAGSTERAVPLAGDARLDPAGALARALGRAPDGEELALFAAMPTDRRAAALARIPVLRRWVEEPGELTAAEAAREAEVAVSRFYEIASAWKASPTLMSLGTFAKRPGRKGPRLSGEAVNTIQSILPELVADGGRHAKTATVVARLVGHPRLAGADLPHVNTLRTMVDSERRRQRAEQQVGVRPGLDATACELLRSDGRYHVVFAVVDRTSRLILGFSVGDLEDSRAAYARAARDVLERIAAPGGASLPWADATDRVDVIAGADVQAWTSAKVSYETNGGGPPFGLVDSGRRFGRYLRIVAGDAIGEMRIFPARTGGDGPADAGLRYTDADAMTAIEVDVARHNASVMAESVAQGAARPAPDTVQLLEFLARA